jgi:hypothetical protein
MQTRELQERQEQALFDNRIAQAFMAKGKAQEFVRFLEASELRLCSGMSAEEIDAVIKRANEACEKLTR